MAAKKMIDDICFVPEVGKLYYGKVVRILPIGAFVEIAPGHDGMVHISKLENRRVEKVEDVLNLGDMTWVKFMGFDEKGRANFSRKDYSIFEKTKVENLRFSLFLKFFVLSPFAELSSYLCTPSVTNDDFCSKSS